MDEDFCSLWEPVLIYLVLVFNKSIKKDDSRYTSKFAHNVHKSLNTYLTMTSINYHSDSLQHVSLDYKLCLVLWEAIISCPGTLRSGNRSLPLSIPWPLSSIQFVSNGPLRAVVKSNED